MTIRKKETVYSDIRNDLAPNPATGDCTLDFIHGGKICNRM